MSSSPGTEESLPFDQEGNQNSTDSFEKQLEQQERELQEQLRLQEEEQQEQEAVKPAEDQDAIPTPVAAPTTMMWQQVYSCITGLGLSIYIFFYSLNIFFLLCGHTQ